MNKVKLPVAVIATFIWIGFVLAISFMESWLKFKAPGVTIPVGLGIGRLVFQMLNKVEWILLLLVFVNFLMTKEKLFKLKNIFYFIPVLLVALQSFWVLPVLDIRAQLHIDGLPVPPSNLHYGFVLMEIVKIVCLFLFGFSLFTETEKETAQIEI